MAKRAIITALLVVVAVAGCGASSPRDAVSSAVKSFVNQDRDGCCELGERFTVSRVNFSLTNPNWAVVTTPLTDLNGHPDGTDYFVLQKTGSSWHVLRYGKDGLGCPMPPRIRKELGSNFPADVLLCEPGG